MRIEVSVKTYYYQCVDCGHEQADYKDATCDKCGKSPTTKNVITDMFWTSSEIAEISMSSLTLDISDLIAKTEEEDREQERLACKQYPLCIEDGDDEKNP